MTYIFCDNEECRKNSCVLIQSGKYLTEPLRVLYVALYVSILPSEKAYIIRQVLARIADA